MSFRDAPATRPWHVPMAGSRPGGAASLVDAARAPVRPVFRGRRRPGGREPCTTTSSTARSLHGLLGLSGFVFFAIWWPWMNFTWFASAYDTDDVAYRLLTFVQIAGVLVVTAGVPSAFESLDVRIFVTGYVIMRIGLVAQWLRAAREDPAGRPVALRFAAGIFVVQLLWVLRLALDGPIGIGAIIVIGLLDLAIPIWAERSGRPTPWHPEHIGERYGLFTIIVLGECVLATSGAVQLALAAGGLSVSLLAVALGGLILVFGLWWSYFKSPAGIDRSLSLRQAITWGYSHYFVFGAIAALGAGLQVAVDATHQTVALTAIGGRAHRGHPGARLHAGDGVPASHHGNMAVHDTVRGRRAGGPGDRRGRGLVRGTGGDPADGPGAGRVRRMDGRADGPGRRGGGRTGPGTRGDGSALTLAARCPASSGHGSTRELDGDARAAPRRTVLIRGSARAAGRRVRPRPARHAHEPLNPGTTHA